MNTRSQTIFILSPIKVGCFILLLDVICIYAAQEPRSSSGVLCRPDFSHSHRRELALRLREITGWAELSFEEDGRLRLGGKLVGGSQAARELLSAAVSGNNISVLEDASNRADVVFCRVVQGRWTRDAVTKPPAYIVQVDFGDFRHVTGDRAALAAFNVGWAVLHELAHVVHDSSDAAHENDVGECERMINGMRRDHNLAERAEYYFSFLPGMERTELSTKFVRLAFEQRVPATNKTKRFWLIWDARIVGGLMLPEDRLNRQRAQRARASHNGKRRR